MNISHRLLLGYFLIVGLAAWFVLNVFTEEVKPGVRQAMEETLVDTSQLLAELAAQDLRNGELDHGRFAEAFERYRSRAPSATIWGFQKDAVDLRVYVTDAKGIVVYDSTNLALGQDYSRWNDVYLTLRGQYGARSTRTDPNNERTSVMYIAAPIKEGSKLLGVLTVAKATSSVQPFIDRSRSRIERAGWWLMGGALLIGLLFTGWLTRSIGRLRRYAREVSMGSTTPPPELHSSELGELGRALAEMREKLDGREYVENYVHHLAHEMKSPLTALIGSAELLDGTMPEHERAIFTRNIREQSERLREMLDKLLALAKLEHRDTLENVTTLDLHELVDRVVADHGAALRKRRLTCINAVPAGARISGEEFLLRQAISNLVDNAISFSPDGGEIHCDLDQAHERQTLTIHNQGDSIPAYALSRVFERFYSLPRPGSDRKSTGLGLPFVQRVAQLHGGSIELTNAPQGGVSAKLRLPA